MQLEEILAIDLRPRALREPVPNQVDILLSWFDRESELVFANQTRKSQAGSVVVATLVFGDGSNGVIRDDFAFELCRSWPITAVGDLLLAVQHDDQPWASGRNVLRTMRTLFAIEESIRSGKTVRRAQVGAAAAALA